MSSAEIESLMAKVSRLLSIAARCAPRWPVTDTRSSSTASSETASADADWARSWDTGNSAQEMATASRAVGRG